MKRIPPSGARPGVDAQPVDVPPLRLQTLDPAQLVPATVPESLKHAATLDVFRRADGERRAARRTGRDRRLAGWAQLAEWDGQRAQLRRALRRAGIPLPVEVWGLNHSPHSGGLAGQVHGHWLHVDFSGQLKRVSGEPVRGAADLMEWPVTGASVMPLSPALLNVMDRARGPLRAAQLIGFGALVLGVVPPLLLSLARADLLPLLTWFISGIGIWGLVMTLEIDTRPGWGGGRIEWIPFILLLMIVGCALLMSWQGPGLQVGLWSTLLHLVSAPLSTLWLRGLLVGRLLAPDLRAPEFTAGGGAKAELTLQVQASDSKLED